MEKNGNYSEVEEENDDFMVQSNCDDLNDGNNSNEDYDDFDPDYEDLEDKWYEIETEYTAWYSDITDDVANVEPGRFDRTMDRSIGRRRGKSPGEVRDEIENW